MSNLGRNSIQPNETIISIAKNDCISSCLDFTVQSGEDTSTRRKISVAFYDDVHRNRMYDVLTHLQLQWKGAPNNESQHTE